MPRSTVWKAASSGGAAVPAAAPQAEASAPAATELNKSSARILRLLAAFAEGRTASLGVSELSRRLGMSKNMVFRALNTLADEGYVVRDRQGSRYTLGYRVFDLCTAALEVPDIRALCAPFLRQIHELTGETVLLSIAVGYSSVVVDGIEGRGPLLSRVAHGRPIPLHAGPGSRALLSFLPDSEIKRYIAARSPLAPVTPTTIVDPELLWAEIRRVRTRGYALGYRDNLSGVTGVSFPVFGADGDVQGAISAGGPEDQCDDAKLASFIPGIARIVAQLNQRSKLLHFGSPYRAEF